MNKTPDDERIKVELQNIKNLIRSNQSHDAELKARNLVNKYPRSLDLQNLLDIALIVQKKMVEAETVYLKLIKFNENFAEAHNNLGEIYFNQKKNEKAIYHFEKALVSKPNLPQAHFNLAKIYTDMGNMLHFNGKIEKAIENYKRAIKNKSDYVEAHNNLGVALQSLGKLEEAVDSFKKAIEIKHDYAESYNNLGNIFITLNKIEEAVKIYQKAIKIKSDYFEAHSNLGAALDKLGRFEESITHYQEAIKIKPDFEKANNNLAASFVAQGRFDEAILFYNKTLKLNPNKTQYAINANLLIPTIPESNEDLKFWRDKYNSAIDVLKKNKYFIDDPQKVINPPTFNLSYSNFNNLNIMKKVSSFFRSAIPVINFKTQRNNTINQSDNKTKRIKIGFISEFFTDHTIGKLFKGLIKAIDKDKFELLVFHFQRTKHSKIKEEIESCSEKVICLDGKISDQHNLIEKELLDIIFYPDIGMTASTYFLAHARLAPVQIVSWGHPETSGISTIDYFLSSALTEGKGANSFYSERLICLDSLLLNFIPPKPPVSDLTRTDLGLSENKNLYCCPQTLFKIHPDFDEALAKIVEKDSNSQIIMIETRHKTFVEKLRKRWSTNFPVLGEKVKFLKSMPTEKFLSLIKVSNVLLDPFYFGGGLSFAESAVIGTPTITMPNEFMRSCLTAGLYKQMKIKNPPIVKNMNDYVDLAIELAKNKSKNYEFRNTLKHAAKLYLFNNTDSVRKFESFLMEAYKANQLASYLKDGHIIL